MILSAGSVARLAVAHRSVSAAVLQKRALLRLFKAEELVAAAGGGRFNTAAVHCYGGGGFCGGSCTVGYRQLQDPFV